MMEKIIFDREAAEPSYGSYKEDLVAEYIWLDAKTAKLYRYVHSDDFEKLAKEERDELKSQLNLMQNLLMVIGDRAKRAQLWDQIVNILQ